jgi:hypothetical protein
LAASTARFLTGQEMEDVNCDETTGERQLIGTQEMERGGQSYWRYEKAMRAVTGFADSLPDSARESETGRILRLDEILRLSDRAFALIKKLRQLKPGESYNGRKVLPGFAAIGTANPPGPRYPHSHELNPAMEREFQVIEVDYPPMSSEDPELYEFMLAALMNDAGLIPASYRELSPVWDHHELVRPETLADGRQVVAKDELNQDPTNPSHGSLYRLSFATRQVQNSFINGNAESPLNDSLRYKTDKSGVIKLSSDQGEPLKLSHSTLTLGEISSWLISFPERYQKDDASFHVATLTEYISMKLNDYIGKAHPEDRPYLQAIFDYYHLFDGPPDLSSAEPMTPKDIGYLSPRVPRPLKLAEASKEEPQISPVETPIPPLRRLERLTTTEVMMSDGSIVLIDVPAELVKFTAQDKEHILRQGSGFSLNGERLVYMGRVSSQDPEPSRHGQIVVRIGEGLHRTVSLDEIIEHGSEFAVLMEEAAEILGKENFIGPSEIQSIFNLELNLEALPAIPFSRAELEKAKELGQFLIYRPAKTKDGNTVTMARLHENVAPTFDPHTDGKDLYDSGLYRNERFFKEDTAKEGWALSTGGVVPGSTSKNYLEQTEVLVAYAKQVMASIADATRVNEFEDMIREYERRKTDLDRAMREVSGGKGNWKKLAKDLSELKVNKALRSKPIETYMDVIAYYKNTPTSGTRLLDDVFAWTNTCSSRGYLVGLGVFEAAGIGCVVDRWLPGDSSSAFGVPFSRNR